MRLLGLDIGDRRIGVALSDPLGILASSLGAIERRSFEWDIQSVIALANENGVERIVVGLPRKLDGSLGEQARKVVEFAQGLMEGSHFLIEYWDERFSTIEASDRLREAGAKKVNRGRIDAAAASYILQGYLDSRGRTGGGSS
jgi:putative Holliday junction resolvase